jgi:hypothetical protein
VLTLWGRGGGFGAHSPDVPGIEDPEEKKLYAGPAVALGLDDGSGGYGTVLL